MTAHAVWTGSTNWTEDSWSREENLIAVVDAQRDRGIATPRTSSSSGSTKRVRRSGKVLPLAAVDGVRAWFSPKRGGRLAHRIADAIASAEQRVRIASPLITSGPILGTLADVVADGAVDLAGVVDNTQVNQVLAQWAANPIKTWKAPTLGTVLSAASFSGKRSTPYAPGAVHDYMHAKVTVCDDTAFVGSFNLSHSRRVERRRRARVRGRRTGGHACRVHRRRPQALSGGRAQVKLLPFSPRAVVQTKP